MPRLLPWVVLVLMAAPLAPSLARPALVCRVTAWVPYVSTIKPGPNSTSIFEQTADLLEERWSGTSAIRRWTVIADRPDQIVAVDPARSMTLVIAFPGGRFAESGVGVQRRGYCLANDLP